MKKLSCFEELDSGFVWKTLEQSLFIFLNTKTHAEKVAEEEIMLLRSVVTNHGHFCFFIDSR